ncbi:MAG TPA: flagellar biosynthesis anti-sigma factor FlgM [Phycisphaerales bacterium]|nr:flagellar biosynthesis anti-sigma factor FlgM [Phycisphaerales bacterium]
MADLFSVSGAAHARAAYQAGAVARNAEGARKRGVADTHAAGRADDLFEVSDAAHFLAKLRTMPEVRQDVVDRAKQQIANGTIDTPEKLEHALDEMVKDVLGEE